MRLGWINQMSLADTEVRWHQKRIDLAFVSADRDLGTTAVELKVNSTSRAIAQARLNQYAATTSWVATWAMPSPSVLALATAQGIGVLLVTDRGAYPALHAATGEPATVSLTAHLSEQQRRVRDLLSALRHG